jgi:hypothetical protein
MLHIKKLLIKLRESKSPLISPLLLLLAIGLAISLGQACKKTELSTSTEPNSNVQNANSSVTERDDASIAALNDSEYLETDFHGRTLYEHMKYHAVDFDPKNYLPESIRGQFVDKYLQITSESEGKTNDQLLDELVEKGIISTEYTRKMRDFRSLVGRYGESNPSFGQIWFDLKQFEESVRSESGYEDPNFKDEYDAVIAFSSYFRHYVMYQYEMGFLTERENLADGVEEREECFLGIKISCWEEKLEKEALNALKAVIEAIPNLVTGNIISFIKSIKKALLFWGMTGQLVIFLELRLDDKCACNSTETPPSGDPCKAPVGITLSGLADCNTSVQTVYVYGQGANANTYTYTITNGTFPDFPGQNASVMRVVPHIKVKQTDPNIPISLEVIVGYAPGCPANTVPLGPIIYNLPQAVNGTGTVAITGATNISWGDPTVFLYDCTGTWLAQPNTFLSAMAPSYHGTTTSTAPTNIRVRWNVAQSGAFNPASVSATVKNTCSNNTTSAWLSPIIIQ